MGLGPAYQWPVMMAGHHMPGPQAFESARWGTMSHWHWHRDS